MMMADERQRMLIECQTKMMQDVMDRNREGQNEGVHGVSLADFLNNKTTSICISAGTNVRRGLVDGHRKEAQHGELQR
jgi:hypothetical protein